MYIYIAKMKLLTVHRVILKSPYKSVGIRNIIEVFVYTRSKLHRSMDVGDPIPLLSKSSCETVGSRIRLPIAGPGNRTIQSRI